MTGSDVSKAPYIIGKCIRNEKAPLDTESRVEKAECLKVYPLERNLNVLEIKNNKKTMQYICYN